MQHFHLSKDQVGAAFAKGSRYANLSEYTQELRLEYAKLLLTQSHEMSVTQIAERCGFSSYNYFAKCFRARYGMTPSEFRNSA